MPGRITATSSDCMSGLTAEGSSRHASAALTVALLVRVTVSLGRVMLGLLTVIVSRCRMLLGFVVVILLVVMGGLQMMMRSRRMVRRCLVMMIRRGVCCLGSHIISSLESTWGVGLSCQRIRR